MHYSNSSVFPSLCHFYNPVNAEEEAIIFQSVPILVRNGYMHDRTLIEDELMNNEW